MTAVELALGWGFIAVVAFILGKYTRVLHRAYWPFKKAGGAGKQAASTNRMLGVGGFAGGLWLGPAIWEAALAAFGGALGGFAGFLALDALPLGLSPKQALVCLLLAVVVFAVLYGDEAAEGEDDD